jgi:hypothetical protein
VFENRVLRRIFGPKSDEATGEWKILHYELYDLYILPRMSGNQIKKNKVGGSSSMYGRQARCVQGFWWGDLMERNHLEDQGIYGRIILKLIKKCDGASAVI